MLFLSWYWIYILNLLNPLLFSSYVKLFKNSFWKTYWSICCFFFLVLILYSKFTQSPFFHLMLTCLRVFLKDLLIKSVAFPFLVLISYSKITQSPFVFINNFFFLEWKICPTYVNKHWKLWPNFFSPKHFLPKLFVINITTIHLGLVWFELIWICSLELGRKQWRKFKINYSNRIWKTYQNIRKALTISRNESSILLY